MAGALSIEDGTPRRVDSSERTELPRGLHQANAASVMLRISKLLRRSETIETARQQFV
jgi:hypothetical protein